jgi:hypothetical protein
MNLELGVIGNCEIAALVDESARIVWAACRGSTEIRCSATAWWAS